MKGAVYQGLEFLGIVKIRWALTGNIYDPGYSIANDFGMSACTLVIKQSMLNTALHINLQNL